LSQTTIYTEEELIVLLKSKSNEAFNYLYTHYAPVLYGIILKIVNDKETANDVLQDTFVKVWNNIHLYNSSKGRLYTWLLNVARNTAIDKLRSKGEIMRSKIQMGDEYVNSNANNVPVEIAVDKIGIPNLINSLKREHAASVQLAYYEGYTMDEIAQKLQIPLGTVKTRMRNALQQLRNIFKA